jgi:hypothetical protein
MNDEEIYLDLRVKVNAVSLFSDPRTALDLIESNDSVQLYTPPRWDGDSVKISMHGVNICCAELHESSYSALAEIANLRAVEDTEDRIDKLNSYLSELKK